MSLSCGIIGLPNVGKSTLFNSLSDVKSETGNFPYTTTKSVESSIKIPDSRLLALVEIENPKSIVQNTMNFIDIAGLDKGAGEGAGIGNQFLDQVRYTDALIHLIRCFDDPNIVHPYDHIDPVRDKEIVEMELLVKDLEVIEKATKGIEKKAKSGDKESNELLQLMERIKAQVEQGAPIRKMKLNDKEKKAIKGYTFLSAKNILYVANVRESDLEQDNEYVKALKKEVEKEGAELLSLSAKLEEEIADISEEEKDEYFDMYGLKEPGVIRLIHKAYKALNLITFFTVGKDECRAWAVKKNASAPEAAGVIHSDFQKGFIRANVIHYNDFIELKSEIACRDKGKMSTEGKDYILKDGDIMHFLFNV